MEQESIRILVVDDSAFFREALREGLFNEPGFIVAGEACDASEAMRMIGEVRPDVVSLDVEMPGMSGIEFLKRVMPKYGIPVVVVSSVTGSVFDALCAGAVDFVAKPEAASRTEFDLFFIELKMKLRVACSSNRSALLLSGVVTVDRTVPEHASAVVMGAATGGTEAIYTVLRDLPLKMPCILVVQTMPASFAKVYAERLNQACSLEVRVAEHGDRLHAGLVLIAPGNRHMCLIRTGDGVSVVCMQGERINSQCPSVDALFQSASEVLAERACGVLLSGMGVDGANGLLKMRRAGAMTIGQNEETAVIYGMSKVAHGIGAVERLLPLEQIAGAMLHWAETRQDG